MNDNDYSLRLAQHHIDELFEARGRSRGQAAPRGHRRSLRPKARNPKPTTE